MLEGEGLEEEAIDEPEAQSAGDQDEIVCVHRFMMMLSVWIKGNILFLSKLLVSICSIFLNNLPTNYPFDHLSPMILSLVNLKSTETGSNGPS